MNHPAPDADWRRSSGFRNSFSHTFCLHETSLPKDVRRLLLRPELLNQQDDLNSQIPEQFLSEVIFVAWRLRLVQVLQSGYHFLVKSLTSLCGLDHLQEKGLQGCLFDALSQSVGC